MSVIFATQLTVVATVALAALAFPAAVLAGLAFWKQSQEVRAIERQVKDQEELTQQQAGLLEIQRRQLDLQQKQFGQQAEERRRAQASRIFIWTEPRTSPLTQAQRASMGTALRESTAVHVKNTSQQPIYDLTISWHQGTARRGEPDHIPVLLPDKQADLARAYPGDLPPSVDLSLFGAVARFRDATAVNWLLRADGHLDEDPPTQ